MRTARSRTSGENRFDVFFVMAPPSQAVEPPANPERFIGKDRQYNRRFLQMCAHHLVDPVACTPASGWETGQVENQVGLVRERLFTPRLRFKSYDELNAWLIDKCVSYAKAHRHPERPGQTVWEVFE